MVQQKKSLTLTHALERTLDSDDELSERDSLDEPSGDEDEPYCR